MIIAKLPHLGVKEVFSVATSNGFFTANDVVVSNCDAIADLNAMYDYDYVEPKKKETRVPGTYVKPLEDEDDEDFTSSTFTTDEW